MSALSALRGILRAMRDADNIYASADEAFKPLAAWLRKSDWGGTGTGVGLVRAPRSIQDSFGNPSPYFVDNVPFILSQSEYIRPRLLEDIEKEGRQLNERRRVALMPKAERKAYDAAKAENGLGGEFPFIQAESNFEDASIEELLNMLSRRDLEYRRNGWDPAWFAEESRLNNLSRARNQIGMFADILRDSDFSGVSRDFSNPYYGMFGQFLPKREFAIRPRPTYIGDIPF